MLPASRGSRGPTAAPCYRIPPRTPRIRRETSRRTAPVLDASAKPWAQPARCSPPRSSTRLRPKRWRRGSWRRGTTTARRCRRWAGSPPGNRCWGSEPASVAWETGRRTPLGETARAGRIPRPLRTRRACRRTSLVLSLSVFERPRSAASRISPRGSRLRGSFWRAAGGRDRNQNSFAVAVWQ